MDCNLIKKRLITYIKEGNKKFIIYPYGENGVYVKNILHDYFNISPRLIVDNTYCQYNPNIISFEQLKKEIQEDDYILLTIENDAINEEMQKDIERIHDKNKIINLLDDVKEAHRQEIRKLFESEILQLLN